MAITSTTTRRLLNVTTVTVVSDLAPPVYFHWYVDGSWVGRTMSGRRQFHLADGEQARIDVNDTTDPDYDAIANAPAGYPARRTLWWLRSIEAGVGEYLIEEKVGAGSWAEVGRIPAITHAWIYQFVTGWLTDLETYEWRIKGFDAAGNEGFLVGIGPETIVRRPDAPNFTAAFNAGPATVTFAAAA